MVLLASWCGLRLGELTELRRSDVDLGDGVIRVRRAMVCVRGEFRVTTPKSEADIRDVNIPPHLLPTADHMASHVGVDQDALVFPARHGGHLAPGTLYEAYYRRAEVVAVRASLRRVRDPLPGRRLHQLAQHMYKPMPQTTARSAIRGDLIRGHLSLNPRMGRGWAAPVICEGDCQWVGAWYLLVCPALPVCSGWAFRRVSRCCAQRWTVSDGVVPQCKPGL